MDAASPTPSAAALPDGRAALTHWGVLRARGADAATFLHGQLTADMLRLDGSAAQLAGFCSAKGRLQASFVAWRSGPEELLLACPASVLPATLKRLSMFVLRARCKLDDASAEVPLHGLVGASATALVDGMRSWQQRTLEDGATLIRLPDAPGLPLGLVAGVSPALAATPELPLDAWRAVQVLAGMPSIEAVNVDQFVPQMVNLELVGGVDFRKGCYPGQEIVARSQYRGTLKRRMLRFDTDAVASPGQELFDPADPQQPAGRIVEAAPRLDGPGSTLLAEVKIAALGHEALRLGAADGPLLQRAPLPYAVPLDADAAAA